MAKRKAPDYFATGGLAGARRVTTTSTVEGKRVTVSAPVGWLHGKVMKRKRGAALSPEARQTRARLRYLDRKDIRFEQIGQAMLVKALKKARALGFWTDCGPGARSAWRLGGWWSTKRCPKCHEIRYAYERVGIVLVTFGVGGEKRVRRTPWPSGRVSPLLWNRFSPHEDTRPVLGCECTVEP